MSIDRVAVPRRLVAAGAVLALVVAGCIWGDPGYAFYVRNESADVVFVAFGDRSNAFVAHPGESGLAVATLGIFSEPIEILDGNCQRLQTLQASTQAGTVVIDAGGQGRFEPVPDGTNPALLPALQLESVQDCAGSVQAPPSALPSDAATGPGSLLFTGGSPTGLTDTLWRVSAGGGAPEQLVPDVDRIQEPAWSPDGKLVAYDKFKSDDAIDLYVLEVLTAKARLLRADAWAPDWSPKSDRIAVVGGKPADEGGAIQIVDVATGKARALNVTGTDPTLSPDGKWIAYQVYGSGFIGASHLWIVPAAGGKPKELTTPSSSSLGIAWSPDSTSIASTSASGGSSITVYPIDLGAPESITRPDLFAGAPAWSPDGATIVFAGQPGPASDGLPTFSIYSIDVVTRADTRLTEPPEFSSDYLPAWSPDGTRIAFMRGSETGLAADLYVMRADGTGLFLVAQGVDQFAWATN